MSILIIDDEKIIRERLKKLLEIDDYEVFLAENGQEGLDFFYKVKPQVLLLDIKMPIMDGIEMLRRIKQESPTDDSFEIIMITGHGGVDTAIEALKGGAFSYIQKPIEYDELEIEIKRACDKLEMKKALNEHVIQLEERTNELIKANAERKQSEEQVKKANSELIKANQELQETQKQLIQSAKLASIGELATGIAHELNQPITYIRGNAQLVVMDGKDNMDTDLAWQTLLQVETGTTKMMSIINHLKSFAHRSENIFLPLPIHNIINNSLIMFNEQLKVHNIQLEKLFNKDAIMMVKGNHQELEQVFINLIHNAKDALLNREEAKLIIQTQFLPGTDGSDKIRIDFTDNGAGITPEIQEKIFDPFYTTKEIGKGTGLGLSISYAIINDHHGELDVSSVKGEHTTFSICLPAYEETDE